jgi:hypothetical protein
MANSWRVLNHCFWDNPHHCIGNRDPFFADYTNPASEFASIADRIPSRIRWTRGQLNPFVDEAWLAPSWKLYYGLVLHDFVLLRRCALEPNTLCRRLQFKY